MHAGVAHTLSGAVGDGWQFEPGIVLPLAVTMAMYVVGGRALAQRRRRTRNDPWKTAAFAAACAAIGVALLSPLDAISEELFSAHMVQHELLMAVAAPLFVFAEPGVRMLWALPQRARRFIGGVLASPAVRGLWRLLSRPLDAWLLHAVVIWVWHAPVLFQSALTSEAIHVLQHVSFFSSGLLFWWAMVHPKRRDALGLSVIYLFTTLLHTAALGALLATARSPWYPAYGERASAWGLTALGDQQLAGLVMWIPAGLVYLVVALVIVRRWLRSTGWQLENLKGAESGAVP